ncbi:MAG: histidinol dehydrogenase [Firmicutes bacterium]|nr:histidinol dehydrogenase [Bacillota bacterium]
MIKIYRYGEVPADEIFARPEQKADVEGIVSSIISDVRKRGDEALLDYTEKLDGVMLKSLQVTEEEIEEAFAAESDEFIAILRKAAQNIRDYHYAQIREGFSFEREDGITLGQRIMPLEKVGLCVPGGETPLSSTVLMDSIPAKLAGVGELVMVTPPGKDGKVSPSILTAAKVAGVDRIFKVGGAQAVAALAYGTESIPKVDKIVGPGGVFVAEAKRQVFGRVSIDMIAGPSEILVVSDGKSDPSHVAADMLSQAEHDKMASAVLVTDSMDLALAVQAEIERQLPLLIREEIARTSIENNGKIIVAGDLHAAVDIANEIAPEHLELAVEYPFAILDDIRHAGSVFLGRDCPEAVGDYFAGVNHTLPTMGSARFSSPLSVDDFIKKMQFCYYTDIALENAADKIAAFAEKEGLTGHARSVLIRTGKVK